MSYNSLSGSILSILNARVLNSASARVVRCKPLRTEFLSTKDMFHYAKGRCLNSLSGKAQCEYAILMDTRKNKVIAEYMGGRDSCPIEDLNNLNLDKKNTIIMHSHPDSYPISYNDVRTMLKYNINQIIAIDERGRFSMVAEKNEKIPYEQLVKGMHIYKNEVNASDLKFEKGLRNSLIEDILKRYMPKIGLRYISNLNK